MYLALKELDFILKLFDLFQEDFFIVVFQMVEILKPFNHFLYSFIVFLGDALYLKSLSLPVEEDLLSELLQRCYHFLMGFD